MLLEGQGPCDAIQERDNPGASSVPFLLLLLSPTEGWCVEVRTNHGNVSLDTTVCRFLYPLCDG